MAPGLKLLDRSSSFVARRGRYRPDTFLVVVAIVLLAVVAASGLLYLNRSQSAPEEPMPQTTVADAPWVPGAVAWMGRNVNAAEPILAGHAAARSLVAAAFTAVTTDPTAPVSWVVVDAALRRNPAAADVLRRAVPIASYGAGAKQVVVESVLPGTAAQVDALLAGDRELRSAAEPDLALNPNLHASAAQQAILRNGALDMRAAVVLAQLCSEFPVTLTGLPQDSAEHAARRAYRTIVLTAAPGDIDRALAAVPARYRPGTIVGKHGTTETLIWDAGLSRTALDQRTR